jgi:hypothetical protein
VRYGRENGSYALRLLVSAIVRSEVSIERVVLDHFDATADSKRERKIHDHLLSLASIKDGVPAGDALKADTSSIDLRHAKNELGRLPRTCAHYEGEHDQHGSDR